MLIFSLFGCKEQEASNENTDGGNEIEAITYYAQDTLRKTSLSKTYNVDLSENVDSSDGSKPVIVSVRSLSSSPSCNVLSVNSKGFQIDARNSKSCTYEYSVGSATTLSKMRAKDASISAMSGVSLGVATATVLVGDSSELLKPISATTTVDDSVDIFIKTELAQYGDEIGVGFTLDENSLVLPNASVTGSSASASVGDDSITYTPGLGFSGVERILYSYTDGISVLTGSIDVSVSTTVNTAPNAEYFYYRYGDGTQPVPYGETIEIDVKDYISDDDGDTLQLIDVFAYDATLSIPTDFNSNGNNFDDTVFTFSSNNPGRHSITYVVSDNKGGFATGVIDLNVADVYQNILVTTSSPNLLFSPPYTASQAELANLKYAAGPVGDGSSSLDGLSTATHDWVTANGICEARGGALPTITEIQALYSSRPNGGLFSSENWPVDINYWTESGGSEAGSFQSINMSNGNITESAPSSDYNYVACISRESVTVSVLGEEYINVGSDQSSVIELYELEGVQADGTTEIIDNPLVAWSSQIEPPELAQFNNETAELTTFPQAIDTNGTATITGCTKEGICDSKLVNLFAFFKSPLYGTVTGSSVEVEYVLGDSNTVNTRCGQIVDAIGTPEMGLSGGNSGSLKQVVRADTIRSVNVETGLFSFAGSVRIMTKLKFNRADGTSVQCGNSGSTSNIQRDTYTVPDGYVFYGFRAYSVGRKGYLQALQFLSIPTN